jgi:hypothetical protein
MSIKIFASVGQGEGAWRMAFCAQRKSCFRFAPCALRSANFPGPVKHPQKLLIKAVIVCNLKESMQTMTALVLLG